MEEGLSVKAIYSIPPTEGVTTHLGYLFDFEGVKLYNMGDSSPEVAEDPDEILQEVAEMSTHIGMFPVIGDYPGRRPEDALKFAMGIRPSVVIPTHYDCFRDRTLDPQEFVKLFEAGCGVKPVVVPYGGVYVYGV